MYKIYNNEIKILQFLKGGSVFSSLAKSASFLHPFPIESKLYDPSRLPRANSTNFGFLINFKKSLDDEIDFKKVRPLFAQEIDYKTFDQKMYIAILLTLSMFKQYDGFISGSYSSGTSTVDGYTVDSEEKFNKVKKNLAILGISALKALQLFDHNKNDFVDYSDFQKKVASTTPTSGGELKNGFIDNKTGKELAQLFTELIINPTSGDFTQIDLSSLTVSQADAAIKAIEKDVFQTEEGIENTAKIPSGYTLKVFYEKIKALKDLVLTSEECLEIYFRQNFRINTVNTVNPRFIGGAIYDQLDYMLNGGSFSTIVRIPNLSNYFKSQLKFIEQKLKINNKTLSEKSKGDINQIIDALDRHEKDLRDQFELLKNAHLIDSDVIRLDKDADKLKKAKNSLNKHIRYSGALGDIIRTIARSIKDEVIETKSAFDTL